MGERSGIRRLINWVGMTFCLVCVADVHLAFYELKQEYPLRFVAQEDVASCETKQDESASVADFDIKACLFAS